MKIVSASLCQMMSDIQSFSIDLDHLVQPFGYPSTDALSDRIIEIPKSRDSRIDLSPAFVTAFRDRPPKLIDQGFRATQPKMSLLACPSSLTGLWMHCTEPMRLTVSIRHKIALLIDLTASTVYGFPLSPASDPASGDVSRRETAILYVLPDLVRRGSVWGTSQAALYHHEPVVYRVAVRLSLCADISWHNIELYQLQACPA